MGGEVEPQSSAEPTAELPPAAVPVQGTPVISLPEMIINSVPADPDGYGSDQYSEYSDFSDAAGGVVPELPEHAKRRRRRRRRRLSAAPLGAMEQEAATPRTLKWRAASEEAAGNYADGNLDAAERLYRELADAHPDQAELCLYHVAVIQEQRGEFVAADSTYGEVETR